MVDRRQFIVGGGTLALAGAGAVYMGLRGMGSMEAYNASVAATRTAIAQKPETLELIRIANERFEEVIFRRSPSALAPTSRHKLDLFSFLVEDSIGSWLRDNAAVRSATRHEVLILPRLSRYEQFFVAADPGCDVRDLVAVPRPA